MESCQSYVKLTINHCMSRLAILPKSIDVTLVIFCAALARVGLFWGGFSVAQRCVCHPSGDYGMLVPSVKLFQVVVLGCVVAKKNRKQDWYRLVFGSQSSMCIPSCHSESSD